MAKNEPKQVIVMRRDLNMRKGKMVAQGAHASMKAVLSCAQNKNPGNDFIVIPLIDQSLSLVESRETRNPLREWLEGRFTKVCVGVNSEEELLDIYETAKDAGLICALIEDAGLTEFDGIPTLTCAAIGPAYPEDIDPITGDLKLL